MEICWLSAENNSENVHIVCDGVKMSIDPLQQLVYCFNTKPDAYIDPGWIDQNVLPIWAKLPPALERPSSVATHLNRWLFTSGILLQSYDFDFESNKSKRIFLIDNIVLKDIIYMLGLALFSSYFRKLIAKSDRSRLCAALGEADYAFMHDVMFPWPTVGVVGSGNSNIDVLIRRAPSVGAWALISSFVEHKACTSRFLLKLPRENVPFKLPRALKDERKQRIWDFVIQIIINERHPQWRWLF